MCIKLGIQSIFPSLTLNFVNFEVETKILKHMTGSKIGTVGKILIWSKWFSRVATNSPHLDYHFYLPTDEKGLGCESYTNKSNIIEII